MPHLYEDPSRPPKPSSKWKIRRRKDKPIATPTPRPKPDMTWAQGRPTINRASQRQMRRSRQYE